MSVLVERHLEEIGIRMGRFLRGFDDRSVHLGAPEQFAREFRKLLAIPMLRRPDGAQPMSYADAVREARVSGVDPQAVGPLGVLLQGLGGPATQSSDARIELAAAIVGEDLTKLLREPALRVYVQATDRHRLLSLVRDLAAQGGHVVAIVDDQTAPACPRCNAPLQRGDEAAALVCPWCRKALETLDVLPMSAAVGGVLSFDFLQRIVGLDLVATYQESGDIRPIGTFKVE